MKEVSERTPFKEPLKPVLEDPSGHLYSINGYRDYIVRIKSLRPTEELALHRFDMARVIFQELDQDYGITVVSYDIVLGSNEYNENAAYLVADKVVGEGLEEAKIPEQEAERFFSSLLNYHIDKYKRGGYYVYDLNSHDFVYGKTDANPEELIYFVDLDDFYDFLDPTKENDHFALNLIALNGILKALEIHSGSGFVKLRGEYLNFLRRVKESFDPSRRREIDKIIQEYQPTEDMGEDLREIRSY